MLDEKVREEVERAGFKIRSGLNWRSRGHKQIDRIWPSVKGRKASDDVVAADIVLCEWAGCWGQVNLTGAM